MQITRNSLETAPGPRDWFTGAVYIDAVAAPTESSRIAAASVHFTPGARTAWHTHPFGQTIFVTEGVGRCQRRGGPVEVIRPGDRVFFEPGEDHWHGAAPDRLHDPRRHAAGRRFGEPGDLGRARQRRGVRGRRPEPLINGRPRSGARRHGLQLVERVADELREVLLSGSSVQRSNATLKTAIPASAVRLAAGSVTPRRAQRLGDGRGERRELDQLALLQLGVGGDDRLALARRTRGALEQTPATRRAPTATASIGVSDSGRVGDRLTSSSCELAPRRRTAPRACRRSAGRTSAR